MAKMTNFLMIMTGIVILFYFFGYIENTFSSEILNIVFNPESIEVSRLILTITGFVTAAIGISIAAIKLGQIQTDFIVFAPMVAVFLSFLWDFISIITVISSFNPYIAVILFSPLIVVYLITILEWWRGVTT